LEGPMLLAYGARDSARQLRPGERALASRGYVRSPPTSSRNWVEPARRTFDADVICSHAALCSWVEALTCSAAAAWPSAVLAIASRLVAAPVTAEALAS